MSGDFGDWDNEDPAEKARSKTKLPTDLANRFESERHDVRLHVNWRDVFFWLIVVGAIVFATVALMKHGQ